MLPDTFISADVDALSIKHNVAWAEIKEAAMFEALSKDAATEYTVDPETGLLVIFNRRMSDSWWIWKRGNLQANTTENRLMDSDLLLASCSEAKNSPVGADSADPKGYRCERYVPGPQYSITYRFVSTQRIPEELQMERIEAAVFNQIESWRCDE